MVIKKHHIDKPTYYFSNRKKMLTKANDNYMRKKIDKLLKKDSEGILLKHEELRLRAIKEVLRWDF